MARQVLNIGATPNDGSGDTLRVASEKSNDNFSEIYNAFGDGTTLNVGIATPQYASVSGIATNAQNLVGAPNLLVGIVTASGFVSTANTTPVVITWSGTDLVFSVSGIGSTTLTLT